MTGNRMTAIGAVDIGGTKVAVGMVDDAGYVVLSGSVMKSAGRYLEDIHRVMQRGCRFVPLDKVELRLASLGEDADLIGAARVWRHRFAALEQGAQK